MSLFKKADKGQPARVKAMIWADSGVGKTTAALTWPAPMVVDFREKGSSAYFGDFDFQYLQASNIDDVVAAIEEASRGGHGCSTFIIDPWSLVCEAIVDKWTMHHRRLKKDQFAELQPMEYRGPKGEVKRILRLLQGLDMNVLLICRSKANFVSKYNASRGKTEVAVDGMKSDTLGDLRYEVDLCMHLEKAKDGMIEWEVEKFRGSRFAKLPNKHLYSFGEFYNEFSKFVDGKDGREAESEATQEGEFPHSVLLAKLGELGIDGLSSQYQLYVERKYSLDSMIDIDKESLQEQRKILNTLKGNAERLAQFKEMLEGIATTHEEGE